MRRVQGNKGLVGYWPLDEGGGAIAYDRSGNGNNGTLVNSPAYAIGKFGQALSFNGTNQYVGIPNVKNIGVGFVGTVTFWAKGSGSVVSNERTIVNSNGEGIIIINNDGSLVYQVDSSVGPPYYYYLNNATTENTDNWNFYALNLNVPSSSGTLSGTLYVNGVPQVSNNSAYIVLGSNGNFTNIDIGRMRNYIYGTSYFTGSIGDVRIYNRALSAREVMDDYINPGSIYVKRPGLLSILPNSMPGNTGTVAVIDQSDTSASTGTVTDIGTISSIDQGDTSAISGTVSDAGTIAAIDQNDTSASTGTVTDIGTLASTDTGDIGTASGAVLDAGTLASTDQSDTSSISSGNTGTIAATDANDTNATSGTVIDAGTLASIDQGDTSSISAGNTGTIAVTDIGDISAVSGAVADTGTLAYIDQVDTNIASGTVVDFGTVATTDIGDTSTANGIVTSWIVGVLASIDQNDTSASTGTVTNFGMITANDQSDTSPSQVTSMYFGKLGMIALSNDYSIEVLN